MVCKSPFLVINIIICKTDNLEFYSTKSHIMKAFLTFVVIIFCTVVMKAQDIDQSTSINELLKENTTFSKLNYPKSVLRFYTKNNTIYAWFDRQKADQAEFALLLLGCAEQFGLPFFDYHCEDLSPEKLKAINSSTVEESNEKVRFDILMTDAIITFINNLHFGRFNPIYTSLDIDSGYLNGFCSDDHLIFALKQNDFLKSLLEVQPKINAYTSLQDYLNILYANDMTSVPPSDLEKIIINMERLRWINNLEENYILVNIPSYALELHINQIQHNFRVIVGKPSTPSPTLESKITHFTTAPDWKVPQSIFRKEMLPKIAKNSKYLEDHHYSVYDKNGNEVKVNSSRLKEITRNPSSYSIRQSSGCDNALGAVVFRFDNIYGVYLHDTSQKQLFSNDNRALSHGCIRIENADKLASLLLKYDNSENQVSNLKNALLHYTRKDFILKKPVPVIITYLTCLIKDGKHVFYRDIYHCDEALTEKFNKNN